MKNILFINACLREEKSRTLKIAKAYLDNANACVCEKNLQQENLDYLTKEDINAKTDKKIRMQKLAQEFANAQEIVIAAPFWEFAFPAVLSVYLECVSQADITFKYTDKGSVGLCKAKSMIYFMTSGDNLSEGDNIGSMLLKKLSKLYGIENFYEINAQGLDIFGTDVDEKIEEALESVKKLIDII